jgi:hypothetical protein
VKSQIRLKEGLAIPPARAAAGASLLQRVDFLRLDAARRLDPARRAALGQFMTPPPAARFMASLFESRGPSLRLLDAGAGVGSLTAAFIDALAGWGDRPREPSITAYEFDPLLAADTRKTLDPCAAECRRPRRRHHGDSKCSINSGKTVYQTDVGALGLLRQYGAGKRDKSLRAYLASAEAFKSR